MSNLSKAYLAIILQALIVGVSFYFVKIALQSTDLTTLLAYRFTLTAIVINFYIFASKKKLSLSINDFKVIAPFSLGFPILFFIFQTMGVKLISSSESGIIYAMTPILTFIIAKIFINEKNTKIQILFMLLSISGVIFINFMKGINLGFDSLEGVIYILLSALSFSVYNVFIRKITKKYSSLQISYVVIISGFLFFDLLYLIKSFLINKSIEINYLVFTNHEFLTAILFLAIVSSFLTISLSAFALSYLEATTVSLFQNLSTIVSVMAGVILLKEQLFYYHYIGIVLVLLGTIGFIIFKKNS